MSTNAGLIFGVLVGSAGLWWLAAPVVVSASDMRMKRRNPEHHRKIVRFYRAFGLLAMLIGMAIGLVAR